MQSAAEQGTKISKSEYKRKQINKPIDNDLDPKASTFSAYSKAHLPDKAVFGDNKYEANNSIQATSAVKEYDGHHPEYVPFKNQLFPRTNEPKNSDRKQLKSKNYVRTPFPVHKYMRHSPEYTPFNQAKSSHFDEPREKQSGSQKIQENNSIQSPLPNHEYSPNKDRSAKTSGDKERNDAENERMKMQSNHQKFESLPSSYSGTNYLDKISISQHRTGQVYHPSFEKVNKKKTNFKGGYRNRKRKSRQYLYLYKASR